MSRLDRRQFVLTGMALAAIPAIPAIARGQAVATPPVVPADAVQGALVIGEVGPGADT